GGYRGGIGGDGSSASLINAITGSTTGSLSLTQDVNGGQGGATYNRAAGMPGSASSTLPLTDLVASTLTGFSHSKGGSGGSALFGGTANGTNGANAASNISFTGTGDGTVTASSVGGNGGNALSNVA